MTRSHDAVRLASRDRVKAGEAPLQVLVAARVFRAERVNLPRKSDYPYLAILSGDGEMADLGAPRRARASGVTFRGDDHEPALFRFPAYQVSVVPWL